MLMKKFIKYLFDKYGEKGDPDGLMWLAVEHYAKLQVQQAEKEMFANIKKSVTKTG